MLLVKIFIFKKQTTTLKNCNPKPYTMQAVHSAVEKERIYTNYSNIHPISISISSSHTARIENETCVQKFFFNGDFYGNFEIKFSQKSSR